MIPVCTPEFVREIHKAFKGPDVDGLLTVLIRAVTRRIQGYIGYELGIEERTEVLNVVPRQCIFPLNTLQITEIAEIRESDEGDFDTAGKYVDIAATDYRLDGPRGRLHIVDYSVISGPQTLRVTHTGGLAADEEGFQDNYTDISLACAMQVIHTYKKSPNFGVVSHGGNQGSKSHEEGTSLIKAARDYLEDYVR